MEGLGDGGGNNMPNMMMNGTNLYYEQRGEGFPLVMIMGLSGNLDWWPDELVDALAAHYRVLIFDNRGAGRSEFQDTEYSIPIFAKDTAELMSALKIERAHVFGISMGGMIAQELALLYPERVDKLVLGCTNCGHSHSISAAPEVLAVLSNQDSASPENVLKILLPLKFIQENQRHVQTFIRKYLIAPIRSAPFHRQLGAIMRFDTFERLNTIKVPVLVMTGEVDILVPPENSQVLAENIPNAKLVTYPECGHGFFSQVPEQVYKTIHDFLD